MIFLIRSEYTNYGEKYKVVVNLMGYKQQKLDIPADFCRVNCSSRPAALGLARTASLGRISILVSMRVNEIDFLKVSFSLLTNCYGYKISP